MRVANTAAFYADAKSKGAQFLTEPTDREADTRCHPRDPDGYLIEIARTPACSVYADRHAADS